MRRNLFTLLFCFLLALCVSSCAQQQSATQNSTINTAQTSPAQIVRHEAMAVEIKPGDTTEAAVRLSIADGYHINANPPTYSYLKPTKLDISPANNVSVVGQPVYPPPQSKKFSYAPMPLDVYEGAVEIKVRLRASNDAAQGSFPLAGKLQVQPCDEQQCYPPRTIDVSIPVTIK